MSTIHTEASVAASELEPSASGVYDYSESIIENDEKLDEGLRAPIPIHDDDLDTSLLSDNELEAFYKSAKHFAGKTSTIPPNLQQIFSRLSGYHKWDPTIYKQLQTKTAPTTQDKRTTLNNLPQINQGLQHEISYTEEVTFDTEAQSPLARPEPSGFTTITPAASAANIMDDEERQQLALQIAAQAAIRKNTLSFPNQPSSPHSVLPKFADKHDSTHHSKKKQQDQKQEQMQHAQPVNECSMKELMKIVSNLTSEVIQLQQSLYVKDVMIKNLYLRLKEFDHISFPQLIIERIHIVANYNNKHKYSHKSNRMGMNPKSRMTLSEEDSVSHDHYLGNGYDRIGGGSYNKHHHGQHSSNTFSTIKQHSTVTLEVITRWLPRYNLPSAVKKGLVFIKDDDISDIDDYLTHQMYNDWREKMKKINVVSSTQNLDKMKREEVHKQLNNYMQHERVGLIRIEILRGKKYKRYKRIEKKFESLIIPIADIPKGDTYHILIKVHNPSASIWGPLSNMVSIKVPLKFIDDDDTDNEHDYTKKTKSTKSRK